MPFKFNTKKLIKYFLERHPELDSIPKYHIIHHIDENRENDDISNLMLLTRTEHAKIHKLGKVHTKEQRRKLSEALKKRYKNDRTKHPMWARTDEMYNDCDMKFKEYILKHKNSSQRTWARMRKEQSARI